MPQLVVDHVLPESMLNLLYWSSAHNFPECYPQDAVGNHWDGVGLGAAVVVQVW